MSNFTANIRSRLSEIAHALPQSTGRARRAPQDERAKLEEMLRKVSA